MRVPWMRLARLVAIGFMFACASACDLVTLGHFGLTRDLFEYPGLWKE